jgi:hypothetical protein
MVDILKSTYRMKLNLPYRAGWDKQHRYDTMMLYEVGDMVEDAFEAGFIEGVKRIKAELTLSDK